MSWPKIVYPTGGGEGSTTLSFYWPPRNMTAYVPEVVGEEDYSSHGMHLAVTERVDLWLEFDMPFIALGDDLTAWQTFLLWAAAAGDFDFYPDAGQSAYTTYHWPRPLPKATHSSPGIYQLMGIKWRQSVLS